MLKRVSRFFSKSGQNKFLLIIAGAVTWSITMVKSGWLYDYGLGFWGANGHDGIWHIALAESLSGGNLTIPIFASSVIQNYHIGYDVLLALLHKITFVPVSTLYFQIIPPVLALLVGLLTYKFVDEWTGSKKAAFWSTFFIYFGGGLGFIVGKGESAFWSQQSVSTLINPPFALSLVLILVGMTLLLKLDKKFSFWNLIAITLCFGTLIEIKVYAGLLVLGGLCIAGIYSVLVNRKLTLIKVFLGSLLMSLILYIPLNKSSSGLIVWQPFWFLEQMMGDRLSWQRFYSAMMTYKSGHIFTKEIAAYSIAFIIFLVGNLGTRLIFLFRRVKADFMQIFIYSIILAGITIPTFFLQKGTSWNTIQFFYYSLFFMGLLAGVVMSNIKSKFMIVCLCLLTIPTTIITLKDVYIPGRPPAMLSKMEISALDLLSRLSPGVILTYPFDQNMADGAISTPPRPLYLYTSTSYVSAFSKHQVFLEDEINLDITNYPWQERKNAVSAWYKETDVGRAKAFLKDNSIKYIYLLNDQNTVLTTRELGLKQIYNNPSVTIYQVEE